MAMSSFKYYSANDTKRILDKSSTEMCEALDDFQSRFEVIGQLLDTVSEECRKHLIRTLLQLKLITLLGVVEGLHEMVSAEIPSRLLDWTWYAMTVGVACTVPCSMWGYWKGTNTMEEVVNCNRELYDVFYKGSRCRFEVENLFQMDPQLVTDYDLIDFAATEEEQDKWIKKIDDSVVRLNLDKYYLQQIHFIRSGEQEITTGYQESQKLLTYANMLAEHETAKLYYLQ